MKEHELTGFIIRRKNYRDFDKVITAFTLEEGSVAFLARGVKKPKAKLASFIEPLVETKFRLIGKGNLPILVGARNLSVNEFYDSDMDKRLLALLLTEIVDLISMEGLKNPKLYQTYKLGLNDLIRAKKPILSVVCSIVKFMGIIGIEPEVRIDDKQKLYFDYDEGIVSSNNSSAHSVALSLHCAKLWKAIDRYSLNVINRLKIDESIDVELLLVILNYLEYHYSKKIKSASIWRETSSFLHGRS